MKKFFCLVAIVVLVALSVVPAFAHSGGTDSKGGHYNHDTGEYHYHHGYSAHQHPNGKCPYRETQKSSYDEAEKLFTENKVSVVEKIKQIEVPWYVWAVLGFVAVWVTPGIINEIYQKKKDD